MFVFSFQMYETRDMTNIPVIVVANKIDLVASKNYIPPQPQPQPNPYPNYHPVAPAPAPKPIIIYCDDCYAEPNEPKICAQYRRKPKAEDEVASD